MTEASCKIPLSAGVLRRIAALTYDALLMIAIAFVTTNIYLIFYHLLVGLKAEPINPHLLNLTLFPLLVLANCTFLMWFWLNGGRTLGMRAWHLKLVDDQGQAITLKHCLVRLLCAPVSLLTFGLGYWSCWVDPSGCSWHDRLSKTRIILDRKKG